MYPWKLNWNTLQQHTILNQRNEINNGCYVKLYDKIQIVTMVKEILSDLVWFGCYIAWEVRYRQSFWYVLQSLWSNAIV